MKNENKNNEGAYLIVGILCLFLLSIGIVTWIDYEECESERWEIQDVLNCQTDEFINDERGTYIQPHWKDGCEKESCQNNIVKFLKRFRKKEKITNELIDLLPPEPAKEYVNLFSIGDYNYIGEHRNVHFLINYTLDNKTIIYSLSEINATIETKGPCLLIVNGNDIKYYSNLPDLINYTIDELCKPRIRFIPPIPFNLGAPTMSIVELENIMNIMNNNIDPEPITIINFS